MKDFSFKALIVFIIILISGLILVPLLAPKTIIDERTVNEYNAFVFLAEGEFDYIEGERYYSDIYERTDDFFFDLLVLELYVNNLVYFTNFMSYGTNFLSLVDTVTLVDYVCIDNVCKIYIPSDYFGSFSYRVWGVSYDNIL